MLVAMKTLFWHFRPFSVHLGKKYLAKWGFFSSRNLPNWEKFSSTKALFGQGVLQPFWIKSPGR